MRTERLAQLIAVLRQDSARLRRFRDGLAALERDIRTLEQAPDSIHYCIDFYNLRQYLEWRPGATAEAVVGRGRLELEEYVCALLFHAFPWRLVLLPSYYDEFITIVRALVSAGANLEGQRQIWLTALREELVRQIRGPNGLLTKLELLESGVRQIDEEALQEIRLQMAEILESISSGAKKIQKVVAYVTRFDSLFKGGRLVGLRELVGERKVKFKEDKVFWRARHSFETVRPRREKANDNDARALSILAQMNALLRSERQVCFIISSVDSMRKAVNDVNDDLAESGERIEMRDLEYWQLWFSSATYQGSGGDRPNSRSVELMQSTFGGILVDLEIHCTQLLGQLEKLQASGVNRLSDDLGRDLDSYVGKLEDVIGRLSQPILDGRWLSAVFEGGFVAVSSEKNFQQAVERVSVLLKKVDLESKDWAFIKAELEELLKGIESVLLTAEAEALKYMGDWGAPFISGWRLEAEALREPYTELLRVLDRGGREGALAVIKHCAELRKQDDYGYESHVVMAHALIVQGQIEQAEEEIRRVPSGDKGRPSVELVRASILQHQGRLDEVEEILKALDERYHDPIIWLNLGSFLLSRFRQWGRQEDLSRALGYAREALNHSDNRQDVEGEATALLLSLRLLPTPPKRDSLLQMRDEVSDALAKARHSPEVTRDKLRAVAAEIDVLLLGQGKDQIEPGEEAQN